MYSSALQNTLEEFQKKLGEDPHVYYQPPESVKLVYPCFVYSFDDVITFYANDNPYLRYYIYTATYITKQVDPQMVKSLMELKYFKYDTHYTADNLHHYAFIIKLPLKHVSLDESVDLSEILNTHLYIGGTNG